MIDRVERYAKRVVAGEVPTSKSVYEVCKKHLYDIECEEYLYTYYDGGAANRAIEFFEKILTVQNPKEQALTPFKLLDWQCFFVGSLFGWKVGEDDPGMRLPHTRRFRTAYLESGKGSGKTPLAAGICLYMLIADGEMSPEIYIIGSKHEQSLIPFRDIKLMIDSNKDLSKICKANIGTTEGRVVCEENMGMIKTLGYSSTGKGASGARSHCVLVEEYHEHTTNAMLNMLEQNKKSRTQPLTLIVTNAGAGKIGPCWDEHMMAESIAHGDSKNDWYLPMIYTADEKEPEKNPECWTKANPSLGHVIREDYIATNISRAGKLPDRLTDMRRLNFALWPDESSQWMNFELWKRAEDGDRKITAKDVQGCEAFVGIDLADKDDMTSMAIVWRNKRGRLFAQVRYWTPKDTLEERDALSTGHLKRWAQQGWITAVDGSVLNYKAPTLKLIEYSQRLNISCVVADPYHLPRVYELLDSEGVEYYDPFAKKSLGVGIPITEHPQIYARKSATSELWMPGSINHLEECIMIQDGDDMPRITIQTNPVLRWNVASAVTMSDPQFNRRWDKKKSYEIRAGKIDGLVALTMAVGAACMPDEKLPMNADSWYNEAVRYLGGKPK